MTDFPDTPRPRAGQAAPRARLKATCRYESCKQTRPPAQITFVSDGLTVKFLF